MGISEPTAIGGSPHQAQCVLVLAPAFPGLGSAESGAGAGTGDQTVPLCCFFQGKQ